MSQFDKKFTTSAPIDSPAEYTLSESANRVFQVRFLKYFSYYLFFAYILSLNNEFSLFSGFYLRGT